MKVFSNIVFPAAVVALTVALSSSPMHTSPHNGGSRTYVAATDTVIYPADAYKIGRIGEMPDEKVPDSILIKAGLSVSTVNDTLDTNEVIIPLTPEELAKKQADSLLKAQIHEKDSIRLAKEEQKEKRDSAFNSKPRILETYALPETLQYKRIIQWTTDQDFHDLKVQEVDTSYNYHYYDYPFQRKDVNSVWLGVAGSPTMSYNWFLRDRDSEGVEFYKTLESWSSGSSSFLQYNSKTPHTELAYYGTLLAGSEKESDNVHIFTTQNILPELNVSFLFDRFGGGGILVNEETKNRNLQLGVNYLGKKYMANAGWIHNKVSMGENWGLQDISEVRDTILESREMSVNNTTADSKVSKNTVFLDQQFRIAFNFLAKKDKEVEDTTQLDSLVLDTGVGEVAQEGEKATEGEVAAEGEAAAEGQMEQGGGEVAEKKPQVDTVNRNITSAFIGHSSEYSSYGRSYRDDGVVDTMGVHRLDNKVFLRLQPWSADGIVSKIDVGVGDRFTKYGYGTVGDTIATATENDFYLYAGARGQFKKYINWDAKFHYDVLGSRAGDFDISAGIGFNFYPFRRDRNSPVSFGASFRQKLEQPNFYQEHFVSTIYNWDNDFSKASSTRIEGRINIPKLRFNATVGYDLLSGNVYYDTLGIARQNPNPMSILSASVREEFVIAKFLHLDNQVLFQMTSNPEVVPLPALSFNFRYYAQFVVKKNPTNHAPILTMQVGLNAFWNTAWNTPLWNPVTGTFHNQNVNWYNNGPYFDVFVNMQWKRACIFIKLENAGQGWPARPYDYFASDGHIVTQRKIKFGLFWPFYTQPTPNKKVALEHSK